MVGANRYTERVVVYWVGAGRGFDVDGCHICVCAGEDEWEEEYQEEVLAIGRAVSDKLLVMRGISVYHAIDDLRRSYMYSFEVMP